MNTDTLKHKSRLHNVTIQYSQYFASVVVWQEGHSWSILNFGGFFWTHPHFQNYSPQVKRMTVVHPITHIDPRANRPLASMAEKIADEAQSCPECPPNSNAVHSDSGKSSVLVYERLVILQRGRSRHCDSGKAKRVKGESGIYIYIVDIFCLLCPARRLVLYQCYILLTPHAIMWSR